MTRASQRILRETLPQTLGSVGVGRPMTEAEYLKQVAADRAAALAQVGATLSVLRDSFAVMIDQVADEVYKAMRQQGFWNGDQDNLASKIALVHSELSELLEADRKSIDVDDKIPDYSGQEAEAADTLIRLFDMAGRYEWRLGHAIIDKMHFNLTRPPKHGKKY